MCIFHNGALLNSKSVRCKHAVHGLKADLCVQLELLHVDALVCLVCVRFLFVERCAERNACAAHLAGIRAAAHGEDVALFAGDVLISAGKQADERAVLRQVQRRLIGNERVGEACALHGLCKDLAEKLEFMCAAGAEEVQRLKNTSEKYIREKYDWKRIADKTREVYERLIK